MRVEPRSQVQARACSSNLDGRTTSTGRPADGESRTGSRAARQVTRVVTPCVPGAVEPKPRPASGRYQAIKQCRLEAWHRPESDGQGAALAALSRATAARTVRDYLRGFCHILQRVPVQNYPARCEIDDD